MLDSSSDNNNKQKNHFDEILTALHESTELLNDMKQDLKERKQQEQKQKQNQNKKKQNTSMAASGQSLNNNNHHCLGSVPPQFIHLYPEEQELSNDGRAKESKSVGDMLVVLVAQAINRYLHGFPVESGKSVLEMRRTLSTSTTKEAAKYRACLHDAVSHPRNFVVNWKWFLDMIINFLFLVLLTFVGADVLGEGFVVQSIVDYHDGCFYEALSPAPVQGIGPKEYFTGPDQDNNRYAGKRGTTCIRNNEDFGDYTSRFAEFLRNRTAPGACGNNSKNQLLSVKMERLRTRTEFSSGNDNASTQHESLRRQLQRLENTTQDVSSDSDNQRIVTLTRYERYWYDQRALKVIYSVFIETEWQFVDTNCRRNLRVLAIPVDHVVHHHHQSSAIWFLLSAAVLLLLILCCGVWFSMITHWCAKIKMRVPDLYFGSMSPSVRKKYFRIWLGWILVFLMIAAFATVVSFFSSTRASLVVCGSLSVAVLIFNIVMHLLPFIAMLYIRVLKQSMFGAPDVSYSKRFLDEKNDSTRDVVRKSMVRRRAVNHSFSREDSENSSKMKYINRNFDKSSHKTSSSSSFAFLSDPDEIVVERVHFVELLARSLCLCFFAIICFSLNSTFDTNLSTGLSDFDNWSKWRPYFRLSQILFAPIGLQLIVYLPQIVGSSHALPSTSYVTAVYIISFMILLGSDVSLLSSFGDISSTVFRFPDSLKPTEDRLANVVLLLLSVVLLWCTIRSIEEKRKQKSFIILTAASWNSKDEEVGLDREDLDYHFFRWCRPPLEGDDDDDLQSASKLPRGGRYKMLTPRMEIPLSDPMIDFPKLATNEVTFQVDATKNAGLKRNTGHRNDFRNRVVDGKVFRGGRWGVTKNDPLQEKLRVAFTCLAAVDNFRKDLIENGAVAVKHVVPRSIDFLTFVSFLFREIVDTSRKFYFFPQELSEDSLLTALELSQLSSIEQVVERVLSLMRSCAIDRAQKRMSWPQSIDTSISLQEGRRRGEQQVSVVHATLSFARNDKVNFVAVVEQVLSSRDFDRVPEVLLIFLKLLSRAEVGDQTVLTEADVELELDQFPLIVDREPPSRGTMTLSYELQAAALPPKLFKQFVRGSQNSANALDSTHLEEVPDMRAGEALLFFQRRPHDHKLNE